MNEQQALPGHPKAISSEQSVEVDLSATHRTFFRVLVCALVPLSGPWSRGQSLGDNGKSSSSAPLAAPTAPALSVGDAAPALSISQWVRGEPMTGFTPGTVSVVVFWATWCEASNASIPVLNSAQREYAARGVRVVAVSGRDSEGESLSRVRAVVGAARSKIEFGVAFDDRRRTAHAWMDAAEQEYIPTAFIVDGRGRVAWIGSPLWPPGEFREALASAVAGELDDARREKLQLRWANFVARVRGLEGQVQRARMSGQIDEASRIFDELISLNERSAPQYAMEKFTLLLTPTHEERAYEFAKSAIAGPLRDDPELLNEVAWAILDESGLQKRDLNLALKAARRADELTNGQNAAILDTTARAYQSLGDFNQAVAFQARAVELAPDESERADYAERLREYRQALERGGR